VRSLSRCKEGPIIMLIFKTHFQWLHILRWSWRINLLILWEVNLYRPLIWLIRKMKWIQLWEIHQLVNLELRLTTRKMNTTVMEAPLDLRLLLWIKAWTFRLKETGNKMSPVGSTSSRFKLIIVILKIYL
jgi:hypothetical protein